MWSRSIDRPALRLGLAIATQHSISRPRLGAPYVNQHTLDTLIPIPIKWTSRTAPETASAYSVPRFDSSKSILDSCPESRLPVVIHESMLPGGIL